MSNDSRYISIRSKKSKVTHLTWYATPPDGGEYKTLCGIKTDRWQVAADNANCKRCLKLKAG